LSVEVVDERGNPAPGVPLDVRAKAEAPLDRLLVAGFREDGWWSSRRDPSLPVWADPDTTTDENGHLVLGPLQPGAYVVRLAGEARTVEVRSGESTVVRFAR